MTRLWEPFRGSEIVPKATEGPKNKIEAFANGVVKKTYRLSQGSTKASVLFFGLLFFNYALLATYMYIPHHIIVFGATAAPCDSAPHCRVVTH
jgi:hypothetical protein